MKSAAENTQIDVVATSPSVTSCRKKKYTENESFVENVKDHFNEFIHTPVNEHKACFKHTVQKIYHKFTDKISAFKEGEGEGPVVPLPKAPKN